MERVITGLIGRLQAPPQTTAGAPRRESSPRTAYSCCVCLERIPAQELLELRARKLSISDELFAVKTIYAHEHCLNGKLHPRRLLQFWNPEAP